MRISDWSSDVCSSDLRIDARRVGQLCKLLGEGVIELVRMAAVVAVAGTGIEQGVATEEARRVAARQQADVAHGVARRVEHLELHAAARSEEHTSELQSLMRTSYAVFCLKKKTKHS